MMKTCPAILIFAASVWLAVPGYSQTADLVEPLAEVAHFTPVTREVTLEWDASPGLDIAGYRLYYGTSSRTYADRIELANVTAASVSNLSVHKTYFFVVTAFNSAGLESGPSNEASFAALTDLPPPESPRRQFLIMPSAGLNGRVSPSSPLSVAYGNDAFIAAAASAGYVIDGWFQNNVLVQRGGSLLTVTNATADCTIHVTFRLAGSATEPPSTTSPSTPPPSTPPEPGDPQKHTLTPIAGANGLISPDSPLSVADGNSAFIAAGALPGYVVDQWFRNNIPVQTGGNILTVRSVTSDLTVKVTFKPGPLVQ